MWVIISWIYRQLFYCKRFFIKKSLTSREVPASKIPWVWVGANEEVVTEIVNKQLKFGKVDKKFLEKITGLKNVTWKYIDSKTLEEVEFPPEGIVIKDD
jgi:hypothetical protein